MNRVLAQDKYEDDTVVHDFLQVLTSAISIRTRTIPQTHSRNTIGEVIPRIAILFSGGLDCSVIAWLIHTLLPINEPIDLINVAFENPRTVQAHKVETNDIYNVCPDRITGRLGWEELNKLSNETKRQWQFIEVVPREISIADSRSISHTKNPFQNAKKSEN
jgi:asparagine synthetase B (glutamine-hydrolysing)